MKDKQPTNKVLANLIARDLAIELGRTLVRNNQAGSDIRLYKRMRALSLEINKVLEGK